MNEWDETKHGLANDHNNKALRFRVVQKQEP